MCIIGGLTLRWPGTFVAHSKNAGRAERGWDSDIAPFNLVVKCTTENALVSMWRVRSARRPGSDLHPYPRNDTRGPRAGGDVVQPGRRDRHARLVEGVRRVLNG